MAWLKSLLNSYFDFNYIYAGIITVLCGCLICYLLRINKQKQGRESSKKDIWLILAAALYLSFLLCGTLLNRKMGQTFHIKLIPFWSYRQFALEGNTHLLLQMIYNVFAFVPWPILFIKVFVGMKKIQWSVISAFIFSVLIELTQLAFKLGLFEFDDIFHNTVGAVIGYAIWSLYRQYRKKGVDE